MKAGNNFDRIASVYDLLVGLVFGKRLESAQSLLLDRVKAGDSVLIIGGGSGRLLEQLFEQQPDCRVDYVEASAKMLELARQRVGTDERVNFVHGTQVEIPKADYDCIITAFFLDVFGPDGLNDVIVELKGRLKKGGIWLVTDFNKTGRIGHRILLWIMHLFFRITTGLAARQLQPLNKLLQAHAMLLSENQGLENALIFTALYRQSN